MKKVLFGILILIILLTGLFFVNSRTHKNAPNPNKVQIVTTLFPQYDFAKNIGGEKVEVSLLLPPGVEAHAFEPKPSDITKINNAKLFIYTGEAMEPWAHDISNSADKKVKVVDASTGIEMVKKGEDEHEDPNHDEHEGEHHHTGVDPHIWLDFDNAKTMSKNIASALSEVDPENAEYYNYNLQSYLNKLSELDSKYKNTLSSCKLRTIIYGGHYAFGYLARRYNLEYLSAQGFSPDAEPTAKEMISLISQIKKLNVKYIFHEELVSPKIAETLAHETEVKLLMLNGAHNITKDDRNNGKSYISIMEDNLVNLALGLDCK